MTEALQQEIRTLRSLLDSERDPGGRVFAPLADAYRRAGRVPEALRLLNEGLAKHPDFVTGHVVAARLYVEQGLGAEGALAARRALDLDGENVLALRSLLRVLDESGEAESEEIRIRLVSLEPDFVPDWVMPGGEPSKASAAWEPPPSPEAPTVPVKALGRSEPVLPTEPLIPADAIDLGTIGPLPAAELPLSALASDPAPVAANLDLDLPDLLPVDVPVEELFSLDSPAPEPVMELATLAPEEEFVSREPAEPVLDLGALAPESVTDEPVMDLAALAPEEEVVALEALAPEEPVMDLAALAPEEEVVSLEALAPEETVLDVAALAPEPVADEPVMDLAALAPEEEIVSLEALAPDEPILDMTTLAPEEEEIVALDSLAPDEPVLDMASLAPDDEIVSLEDLAPDESVLDMAALAPEPEEPVMDLAALAPESEPVMDMSSLAPAAAAGLMATGVIASLAAPDAHPYDEPVFDLDALAPTHVVAEAPAAPTPVSSEPAEDAVDITLLTPDAADEIVIDLDALRPEAPSVPAPDAVMPESPEPGAGEPGREVASTPLHDEGEPVYTRTLAELYASQGAVKEAITVLRRLLADDPADAELANRIADLEAGAVNVAVEAEAPDTAGEEEVETLARELAESGAGRHEAPSPFAWADEPETPKASGPSIREYFDGLLNWEPREGA